MAEAIVGEKTDYVSWRNQRQAAVCEKEERRKKLGDDFIFVHHYSVKCVKHGLVGWPTLLQAYLGCGLSRLGFMSQRAQNVSLPHVFPSRLVGWPTWLAPLCPALPPLLSYIVNMKSQERVQHSIIHSNFFVLSSTSELTNEIKGLKVLGMDEEWYTTYRRIPCLSRQAPSV